MPITASTSPIPRLSLYRFYNKQRVQSVAGYKTLAEIAGISIAVYSALVARGHYGYPSL